MALALALVRSLCYTTREDLIPEFKLYAKALHALKQPMRNEFVLEKGVKGNVAEAYDWLIKNYNQSDVKSLYDVVLKKNSFNFLKYDLRFQEATDNPVTKNVGWLDFTHAITFSNAVRITCEQYPDLWEEGLLQMISFYGRNLPFVDERIELKDWLVRDEKAFEDKIISIILDHGLSAPILSSHIVKTSIATLDERDFISSETKDVLLAALNRFLHSPLKQKHSRRLVSQGIKLVAKDFGL